MLFNECYVYLQAGVLCLTKKIAMSMFYIIFSIAFIVMVIWVIYLLITRNEKPKEHIDGKTLIELLVIGQTEMTDSDKIVWISKLINQVDFTKLEIWQVHGFFNLINRIKR